MSLLRRLFPLPLALALAACGARTGLLTGSSAPPPAPDAGTGEEAPPGVGPQSLGCPGGGAQPHAPWPMYMRCATHQGWTEVVGPTAPPSVQWTFAPPPSPDLPIVLASPVIAADGTVYVTIQGDALHALAPDGTKKWSFPGPCAGASPAIGADGAIYAPGTLGVIVYAVDPSGHEKWRLSGAENDVGGSPAIGPDGTIYVGGTTQLYALAPDGSVRWTVASLQGASPSIAMDGTIYTVVGTVTPMSYSWGIASLFAGGTTRWSLMLASVPWFPSYGPLPASLTPSLADDGTVFASGEGSSMGGPPPPPGKGPGSGPGPPAELALLSDGTIKWSYPNSCGAPVAAVDPSGLTYRHCVSERGATTVFALSSTGTPVWQHDTGTVAVELGQRSDPILDGSGAVYAVDIDSLQSFTPDGTLRWSVPVKFGASLAIGADGTLYVGTAEAKLMALR